MEQETLNDLTQTEKQELVQEAKRKQNTLALHAELAVEINNSYKAYMAMTDDVIDLGVKVENARISLGTLLLTAKEQVKHGGFMDWRKANCKDISDDMAERCMCYSKKRKGKLWTSIEDIREYKKLLELYGVMEPNKGHGQQQLHDWNPFAAATKVIGKVNETFALIWEKRPKDEWTDKELEQLKDQLAPLVEIYETL